MTRAVKSPGTRTQPKETGQPTSLPIRESLGVDQGLSRAVYQLIYDAGRKGIDQREILLRLRKTVQPMLTIEEVQAAVKSLVRLKLVRW